MIRPLALIVIMLWAVPAFADTKPNIVFILADDLGINDLGCYGRKDHHTPHLDRLASEGVRFSNAYAACPVCSPTRAALMTGKAPARLHITTFLPGRADCTSQKLLHPKINLQLPLEEKTMAEYLKAAGYATGCFGKWHLGGKGFLPPDQGFDTFYAGKPNTTPSDTEGGKGEYDLTAKAIEFIDKQKGSPFFLYLAHNTPHIPYTGKPALVKKHEKAFEPNYAAMIESMDDTVGILLQKLDDLKLAENTIVVFSSDNGGLHVPELNHQSITHNTPYRAGKGFLYEGGIRVPLIVRWPAKIPGQRVSEALFITTDWLPTFLDILKIQPNGALDGESMVPALTTKSPPADRHLFWHIPHYCNQGSRPSGAVRNRQWKYIEHYEDNKGELFAIDRDPGETQDLSAREQDVAQNFRKQLADWRKKVGAQTNTVNPNFDESVHKKLYVDVDPSRYAPNLATKSEFDQMQEWRKRMNAAVPKPKK